MGNQCQRTHVEWGKYIGLQTMNSDDNSENLANKSTTGKCTNNNFDEIFSKITQNKHQETKNTIMRNRSSPSDKPVKNGMILIMIMTYGKNRYAIN